MNATNLPRVTKTGRGSNRFFASTGLSADSCIRYALVDNPVDAKYSLLGLAYSCTEKDRFVTKLPLQVYGEPRLCLIAIAQCWFVQ